jgi:riboflavin synthase
MFTGIIETTGIITQKIATGTNLTFIIQSPISHQLKVDQSVAHNGICLTVETVEDNTHTITAIQETIQKTNVNAWQINDVLNIERCLLANSRIDGHFVQGHVDATATCIAKKDENGSWMYQFKIDEKFAPLIIEKGSVCVNGISLTCFNVLKDSFCVAIIPYTYTHTNIHAVQVLDLVNIEFDIFGKYMNRFKQLAAM